MRISAAVPAAMALRRNRTHSRIALKVPSIHSVKSKGIVPYDDRVGWETSA